jgi:hypothetical protein
MASVPTVDTVFPATATATSGTSATISLTTIVANEVVILVVSNAVAALGGPPTVTGVSGAGLTWSKIRGLSLSGVLGTTASTGIEVWWAPAAAVVTGQTVTVNFSATISRLNMTIFGVYNCYSITNPWDNNPSLPGTKSVLTGPFGGITYSTTQAYVLLLNCVNCFTATPATGWTSLVSSGEGTSGGLPTNQAAVFTKQVTTPQSGQTANNILNTPGMAILLGLTGSRSVQSYFLMN